MSDRKTLDQMTSDDLDALYDRVERAEDIVFRIGAVARWMRRNYPGLRLANETLAAALDEPAPAPADTRAAEHVYLSTGCHHGRHDYCQSMTGMNGAKRPASCKFCRSVCVCPCHTDQPKEQS